jgi:hypothetical protein
VLFSLNSKIGPFIHTTLSVIIVLLSHLKSLVVADSGGVLDFVGDTRDSAGDSLVKGLPVVGLRLLRFDARDSDIRISGLTIILL